MRLYVSFHRNRTKINGHGIFPIIFNIDAAFYACFAQFTKEISIRNLHSWLPSICNPSIYDSTMIKEGSSFLDVLQIIMSCIYSRLEFNLACGWVIVDASFR